MDFPLQIIEVDRGYTDRKTGVSGRIRRNPSKPVPIFDDARQIFLEERTVFVSGFPRENVTLDQLLDFFESQFEKVFLVIERRELKVGYYQLILHEVKRAKQLSHGKKVEMFQVCAKKLSIGTAGKSFRLNDQKLYLEVKNWTSSAKNS